MFQCVPSKYDTEVTVVVDDTKLIYKSVHVEVCRSIFIDLNGKDATTVRLTQTFQLPFPIDLGKVEVIPTSNRGQDVRVNV